MRALVALLLIMTSATAYAQVPAQTFSIPIEGEQGTTWWFLNHVDLDTLPGKIKDYQCGTKTYDGHQGTDLVIADFHAMDSGVRVVAAAAGEVVYVIDSLFDRNKIAIPALGYGNLIILKHNDSTYTYYAHLRKNSAQVKVGDTVEAEQFIGLVGSSGYASDPHLHFEIWINNKHREPFGGTTCNPGPTLWNTPIVEQRDFQVIWDGVSPLPGELDVLREKHGLTQTLRLDDTLITAAFHAVNVKAGDKISAEWFLTPNIQSNSYTKRYSFESIVPIDYSFYYWWMGYLLEDSIVSARMPRKGRVDFYRNGARIAQRFFSIEPKTGIAPQQPEANANIFYSSTSGQLHIAGIRGSAARLILINSAGQVVLSSTIQPGAVSMPVSLKSGVYTVFLEEGGQAQRTKIVVVR